MKKNKRKMTDEERKRREKNAFKRKITRMFMGMGFQYIPTGGHEFHIGRRSVEVDSFFVYENIWILCEDTASQSHIKEHIRTKNEAFGEIYGNVEEFENAVINILPEYEKILSKYDQERILFYGLYFPKYDPGLTGEDVAIFSNIKFVLPATLNYFHWLVQAIKLTARNEFFRFLEIDDRKIGLPSSGTESSVINAPIIYPKYFTGRVDKVRVVSFMMAAEDLMNSAYVLRKDNWSKSIYLYQRLINKDKIKKIRKFLEEKGEAFYNNIIVVLPDDVRIHTEDDTIKEISEIKDFPEKCELIIPRRRNSIGIIDGQHRVFAHYESGEHSKQEEVISDLRKQLHLLVTGLVFDNTMSSEERVKAQSEIFLDINSNASPVTQSVLLQIKRILDPISNESLAQLVIEKMNANAPFKGLLQLSELSSGRIKTASIVKYALKYLITVNPVDGKESLLKYWNGDHQSLMDGDEKAIDEYTTYCATVISQYFNAVRIRFKSEWDDPESKLLSVVFINGFIIALTRQLPLNGVKDFDFYREIFLKWNYPYTSENFQYKSSQYRSFSTEILRDAFQVSTDMLTKI